MALYPDLVNVSIHAEAGVAMAQFEINDPNSGLGAGPTGSIAAGSGRGMGRYIAVKSVGAQNPAPRTVYSSGDNGRALWGFQFPAADLGVIALSFAAFNDNAYAAFTDTAIDNVIDGDVVGIGTNAPTNASQAGLLFTTDAQDGDVLKFGGPCYASYWYPGVNVSYLGNTLTEAAATDFAYQGVPTQVSRYPWGIPFTLATNKFTRAKAFKLVTKFPPTIHRFLVTGTPSSVTFTLDASPTTDQTGPAIKAWRYIAATGGAEAATLTSVNIATRQVTVTPLSGNFADGDLVSVLYQSFDVMALA